MGRRAFPNLFGAPNMGGGRAGGMGGGFNPAMMGQWMAMQQQARMTAQQQSPQQLSATPPPPQVPPQVLYSSQLSSMAEMGFADADANLRALVATGGNLDAAIARLLG